MAFKLRIVLLLSFALGVLQFSYAQSYKENARNNLKKWGIAYCISQTVKISKIDSLSGFAQAAYFELGTHQGGAYTVIKKYVDDYVKKEYNSKHYQNLSIQECLDLIDDKIYNKKIKFCDKWIIRE